jgi:AAA family ATP:ADP antiporter
MNSFLGVRPDERRTVWVGFATLLTIVASHAVLETARYSLFLADLPASRLPWAYLGIALLAFVAVRLVERLLGDHVAPRALAGLLLLGAVGTAVFWQLVATSVPASLMALYIWTGVLASVVVSQFWIQLGAQMDVGRAKRAYAIIAAGGMLGATLGSALAGAVLTRTTPRSLLGVAAALFAAAACAPFLAGRDEAVVEPARGAVAEAADDEAPALRGVWADPYLKRLLLLAILGPVVAMGIDFIFKSIVSQQVPRAALAPFFARYNMVVNAAALVFQVLVAPRLLQSIGVVRNLCLLPGCLGVAAAGVAATASLPAALLLRGADGVLRHSLHRAATEILFLPLSPATRSALRRLAESIGQRGGQVVGSGLILLALVLGATARELGVAVAVLCGLWLFGYLRLAGHYVERFRSQLGVLNTTPDAAIPALDLQSLETLVATLSAPKDREVLAAIDLLETYGRERLVPPLILYHPSAAIVLRALKLFEGSTRVDVQEIRRRLLQHPEPAVRAAALRALVSDGGDRAMVRTLLRTDPSPVVRGTALALWMGLGEASADDLREAVSDLTALSDHASRLAVASTLGELPGLVLLPVARALLDGATPAIRREVARALATDPDAARIELLTELVARPECRPFVRAGFRALGAPALEHLARVLEDVETPATIRRHLPRSISAFGSARAAEILVAQLAREEDGRVAYKILRGLGRVRADDPSVPVDHPLLMSIAERTLERMITLLSYQVAWEARREMRADGRTTGTGVSADTQPARERDLVGTLLAESEQRALEGVCRVLQILDPSENFSTIYTALGVDDPVARASARELIGHVLTGGCRDGLLALTDSLPSPERLEAAAKAMPLPLADRTLEAWRTWKTPTAATDAEALVAAVVAELCHDGDVVLASVARYETGTRRRSPGSAMEVERAAS